jgi:hypothetical protein
MQNAISKVGLRLLAGGVAGMLAWFAVGLIWFAIHLLGFQALTQMLLVGFVMGAGFALVTGGPATRSLLTSARIQAAFALGLLLLLDGVLVLIGPVYRSFGAWMTHLVQVGPCVAVAGALSGAASAWALQRLDRVLRMA